MPDYSKGKIYKIYSKTLDNCYYGSTTMTLKDRLSKHKCEFKSGRFCKSQDVLKYNDYEIILVELFPCNSKKELERREGYYQKNYKCVNICIAGRSYNEYREDKKEYIKLQRKQFREANKERLSNISKNNYEKNKEYRLNQVKQYREANKEKISEKRKIKITCCCGSVYRKYYKKQHERTKKHISYIESQQQKLAESTSG